MIRLLQMPHLLTLLPEAAPAPDSWGLPCSPSWLPFRPCPRPFLSVSFTHPACPTSSWDVFFIQQDRGSKIMVGKESAACLWWLLISPARAAGASEGVRKEVCFSFGANSQSQEGGVFIRDIRAAYFSGRQGLSSIKLFLYSHTTPKKLIVGSLLSEGFRCFGKCDINISQLK